MFICGYNKYKQDKSIYSTQGFVHFNYLNVYMEVFVMRKFLEWIKQEESGQGMVEYGVIVALVVVIAIAVFNNGTFKTSVENLFTKMTTKINGAIS